MFSKTKFFRLNLEIFILNPLSRNIRIFYRQFNYINLQYHDLDTRNICVNKNLRSAPFTTYSSFLRMFFFERNLLW